MITQYFLHSFDNLKDLHMLNCIIRIHTCMVYKIHEKQKEAIIREFDLL